ncbi:hypothetical protein [Mesorhizobium sp. M1329]
MSTKIASTPETPEQQSGVVRTVSFALRGQNLAHGIQVLFAPEVTI